MTSENFRTVFELGFNSFPLATFAHPFIFGAIGLICIRFFKRKRIFLVIGVFGISMGFLVFLLSLRTYVPKFAGPWKEYSSGKSIIVEGVVQDFHPAPMSGLAFESFTVKGVVFGYDALDYSPCFHDAPLHSGPIREGLTVRIHYYGDCIQRVELLQNTNPR
jgi:hypothetical protein